MTTSPIMSCQDTSWVQEGDYEPLGLRSRRIVERQLALMDTRPLPFRRMCVSQEDGLLVAIGWRDEDEAEQSSQLIMMGWLDQASRDLARLTLEHVLLEALCRRAMTYATGRFLSWDVGAVSRGLRVVLHLEPELEGCAEQLAAQATDALVKWLIEHPELEQRLLRRVLTG